MGTHRPPVRAVLFDIDDTLVDTRGAFRHAFATVGERYLTAPVTADELTLTWRADAGGHYRAHTRGEMSHREQRKRRANEIHAMYGGPSLEDDDAYDAWNDGFEAAFRAGWQAHEDAAACLDELEAAGIPYGALSNAAAAYQTEKLAASGLERVPMLVGVDTLGFGKPDPRVFALACELIGFAPAEVLYVGDELDVDGIGALDAGLHSAWLDRPALAEHGPDPVRIADAQRRGLVRIAGLGAVPGLLNPYETHEV